MNNIEIKNVIKDLKKIGHGYISNKKIVNKLEELKKLFDKMNEDAISKFYDFIRYDVEDKEIKSIINVLKKNNITENIRMFLNKKQYERFDKEYLEEIFILIKNRKKVKLTKVHKIKLNKQIEDLYNFKDKGDNDVYDKGKCEYLITLMCDCYFNDIGGCDVEDRNFCYEVKAFSKIPTSSVVVRCVQSKKPNKLEFPYYNGTKPLKYLFVDIDDEYLYFTLVDAKIVERFAEKLYKEDNSRFKNHSGGSIPITKKRLRDMLKEVK